MTTQAYRRLKDALLEQRRIVTGSKAAATKLINDLGIRHIMVETETAPSSKAAAIKTISKMTKKVVTK